MYRISLFVYMSEAIEVSCTVCSFFVERLRGGVRSRHRSYCFRGKKRGKFENRYVKAVSDCSSALLLSFECNRLRNGHFSEISFDLHFRSETRLCLMHSIRVS